MSEWVRLIISALPGIAAIVTLIYQLVKYVKKAIVEKNWPEIVRIVTGYMERAEAMFDNGADRKEWVLAMVRASAELVKYDLDMNAISDLIDGLCAMSKVVNGIETEVEAKALA